MVRLGSRFSWTIMGRVERAWWALLTLAYGSDQMSRGGVTVRLLDTRPSHDRQSSPLRGVLAPALDLITGCGAGWPELVSDHLHVVAAMSNHKGLGVYAAARAAAFTPGVDWPPEAVAAGLVWAASASRAARDIIIADHSGGDRHVALTARTITRRFIRLLPDAEHWEGQLSSLIDPSESSEGWVA